MCGSDYRFFNLCVSGIKDSHQAITLVTTLLTVIRWLASGAYVLPLTWEASKSRVSWLALWNPKKKVSLNEREPLFRQTL